MKWYMNQKRTLLLGAQKNRGAWVMTNAAFVLANTPTETISCSELVVLGTSLGIAGTGGDL